MIPIMMIVWRFLLSLPPMMRILSMVSAVQLLSGCCCSHF